MRTGTFIGGSGADVFVIEVDGDTYDYENDSEINGYDSNNNGVIDFINETNERPGTIADFENGTDKIGLKGDWSGKTIVVTQGSGQYSAHTYLYKASSDHSEDNSQVYAILANTTASDITEDDFVLVLPDYTTSPLTGVTVSTDVSLIASGLPTLAPILPVGNVALGDSDSSSSSSPLEGGTDFLVELEETGIDIDILISTSALDVKSNTSELSEILLETDTQNSEGHEEIRSDSSLYFHSTDLLEEEDILISFDAI